MSSAKTTIPTVECKVIGNIDRNGFINDFMKEIHIRTRPELNFAPVLEPVPEPPVKSGTGTRPVARGGS